MDSATWCRHRTVLHHKGLGGTGLGLSMVQGFARQSGGDVLIMSAPGVGTQVECGCRRCRRSWRTVAKALSDPAACACCWSRCHRCAGDVGRFLRCGLAVANRVDGDAALSLLSTGERFRRAGEDYAMPGMNGIDCLNARAIQPEIPALLISGFHRPRPPCRRCPTGVEMLESRSCAKPRRRRPPRHQRQCQMFRQRGNWPGRGHLDDAPRPVQLHSSSRQAVGDKISGDGA